MQNRVKKLEHERRGSAHGSARVSESMVSFGSGTLLAAAMKIHDDMVFHAEAEKRKRVSDSPGLICGFCGKHHTEVQKMVAGMTACICDQCAELASDIVKQEKQRDLDGNKPPPTPVPSGA